MGDQVIIVSEQSADATPPVRTERPTSARSRSSAAPYDTPWYTDARPISVHTEVFMDGARPRSPTKDATLVLSEGLASVWPPLAYQVARDQAQLARLPTSQKLIWTMHQKTSASQKCSGRASFNEFSNGQTCTGRPVARSSALVVII
jgi:hypothetical protein